jgi:trans-feruloyl-CoA hydratase/vanillin synthase
MVDFPQYQNVRVERGDGIGWLYLNRPEKRNAMSPGLLADGVDALSRLEVDSETHVLVLTGEGDAWSAGMDLKEYFRATDNDPEARLKASWNSRLFNHYKLVNFPKPTIAMVNGWCFGGAFAPLTSCDFAIAAEDAMFGLSEVNWGIIPGGYVSKDVALAMPYRHALYYVLTGEPFDAKRAVEVGLINMAVPRDQLRAKTIELANKLLKISPAVLRTAKEAIRAVPTMSYDEAWDYLAAKNDQLRTRDTERSRDRGIEQFIDQKVFRPGLGPQPRP